jgi:hypothetical protein
VSVATLGYNEVSRLASLGNPASGECRLCDTRDLDTEPHGIWLEIQIDGPWVRCHPVMLPDSTVGIQSMRDTEEGACRTKSRIVRGI